MTRLAVLMILAGAVVPAACALVQTRPCRRSLPSTRGITCSRSAPQVLLNGKKFCSTQIRELCDMTKLLHAAPEKPRHALPGVLNSGTQLHHHGSTSTSATRSDRRPSSR